MSADESHRHCPTGATDPSFGFVAGIAAVATVHSDLTWPRVVVVVVVVSPRARESLNDADMVSCLVSGGTLPWQEHVPFRDACPMRPQSESASWDTRQSRGSAKIHVSHEEVDAFFVMGHDGRCRACT
jgi:hypothetical protein